MEKQNRRTEAARIFVRELPTVRSKDSWLISLKSNVVLASRRTDDDVVIAWLDEVCDTTKTWDNFLNSGDEFMTLDLQLATAPTTFFKDDKTNVNETSQIMFLLVGEQMKKNR